jgi:hypothetical protein
MSGQISHITGKTEEITQISLLSLVAPCDIQPLGAKIR